MKYDTYVHKNGVKLLSPVPETVEEKNILEMRKDMFISTFAEIIFNTWTRVTPEQRGYIMEASERKDINIQFPYITKEKVLMYGGYSKWNTDIKKLLPNITAIEGNVEIDEETLRTYRTVYLCESSIKYTFIRKVKTILLKENISYSYFNCYNEEKFARKVADFDMFKAEKAKKLNVSRNS